MLPEQRSPWLDPRVLAILLAVFMAGAAVGAMVTKAGIRRAQQAQAAADNLTLAQLQKELDLTKDQSEKLKSILDDMVRYREEMDSSVESYRATGKHRILDILNPTQRTRFEELSKNLRTP